MIPIPSVKRPDNLRSNYTLEKKRGHTFFLRLSHRSLSSFSPELWDLLLNSIKNFVSLKDFKTKIYSWTADHCGLPSICKEYFLRAGFIWIVLQVLPFPQKFFLSFLPSFYLTIYTSYFLVSLHLVIFFSKLVSSYFFNYLRFSILHIQV